MGGWLILMLIGLTALCIIGHALGETLETSWRKNKWK